MTFVTYELVIHVWIRQFATNHLVIMLWSHISWVSAIVYSVSSGLQWHSSARFNEKVSVFMSRRPGFCNKNFRLCVVSMTSALLELLIDE